MTKIHIPEQTFELDETGYARIKFELASEEVVAVEETPVEAVTPTPEVPVETVSEAPVEPELKA